MAFFSTATWAAVAGVTSILGTAVSTLGAYQQSKAAQAQAEYNAAVARNNQIIAQQDADAIRERGKQQEADHRERIRQTIGAARAVQGATGFLADGQYDDTNAQLIGDLAEAGELDILRLRDSIELDARQKEIQAVNFQAEAGLQGLVASQQNPLMAAAGTLLEGAARTAGVMMKTSSATTTTRSSYNRGIGSYTAPNLMLGPRPGAYGR